MTKKFKALKKPPKEGQTYFLLTFKRDRNFYVKFTWDGSSMEYHWLKAQRVYPTKKAVERAAKFINNFIISHKEQLNYITSEPAPGTEVWSGTDMDGTEDDVVNFSFNSSNEGHQLLLKLGLLYSNSRMVQKASKIITKALDMEQKRLKYKFLTEIPKPGTIVYYPQFGVESGVDGIEYDPDVPGLVRYLKLGLLFSKKKHALRASLGMLKQISPLGSNRLKLTEQQDFLTKEGDHE